ncbi:hypothetical protein [Shewanella sp. 10B]|uniref:hypothetical protein n=1 Tax=Shewanella sp. 10B TaxID=2943322 RepID=UPI00201A9A04|nr:hypothetical protein [Shewanella sp. 10B]
MSIERTPMCREVILLFTIFTYVFIEFYLYSSSWFVDVYGEGKSIPTLTTFLIPVLFLFLEIKLILYAFLCILFSLFLVYFGNLYIITLIKVVFISCFGLFFKKEKVIIALMFSVLFSLMFAMVCVSFFGDLNQKEYYPHKGLVPTFGFLNPNTTAYIIFFLFQVAVLFFSIYLSREKLFFLVVFSSPLFLSLLLYVESRTQIINFFLFIFLLFYFRFVGFKNYRVATCLLFSLCVAPFVLIYLYVVGDSFVYDLNLLLAQRIQHSANIFLLEAFPPLISGFDVAEYLPLDIFIVRYLYQGGLVLILSLVFVSFKVLRNVNIYGSDVDYFIYASVISTWAVGLTESYIFTVPFNFVLFFFFLTERQSSYVKT